VATSIRNTQRVLNKLSASWLCFGICMGSAACAPSSPGPTLRPNYAVAPSCGSDALDCCPVEPSGRVTLCQLFAQQTDLRHLTRLPKPAYTSHMVSSFDRASQSAHPGDDAWLANRDFAELTPGQAFTLLDTTGPGVVTRIWSANPSGTLRIYLDGSPQPVIEAPMRELLRGEVPPIGSAFAYEAGLGSNLYLPIAYQSHCTITVTSDARRLFYQISHRRYANATQIEPFSLAALNDPTRVPAELSQTLAGAAPELRVRDAQLERCSLATNAATEHVLHAAPGGSVLRELQVRVSNPTPEALRETRLHIWVDGVESVRVPFGDFFGSGPGLQALNSLPMQVEPARGTFVARWPMPFQKQLRVALEQTGNSVLAAELRFVHQPAMFDDATLIFHANWRAPEWHASEPSHEFTIAALQGQGLYVGTLLNVTNSDAAWWGEGDEKIWLDGETFPSFFGTGSEDYFGYAWCSNQLFSRAYIGQTRADPHANFGRVSLYRFHVLDPIVFSRNLRFDLEVNHWGNTPTPVEYDSVVYYYARPGAKVAPLADSASYRIPVFDVPPPANVNEGPYRCGGGG
jgi:hypothetical protein